MLMFVDMGGGGVDEKITDYDMRTKNWCYYFGHFSLLIYYIIP